jgi:protein phosphatase
VLYQAIGGYTDIYPDTYLVSLKLGEQLICCSDGLNSHVPDECISQIVREAETPQRASDRLVNEANARGGTDNTTVVVVLCDRP